MQSAYDNAGLVTSFRFFKPTVPMIMVPVEINEQGPFDFILDTGNGRFPFLLSPRLARELGLNLSDFTAQVGYTVGTDRALLSGRVDSARIAGATVRCPEIGIAPALEQIETRLRESANGVDARIDGN